MAGRGGTGFAAALTLAAVVAATGARAAPDGSAAPAARATSAPGAAALPASAPVTPRSTLTRTVVEDDAVRIEETRLRGAPLRITVHSKLPGAAPYEIQVAPPGLDPSQERGGAGRRTWSVLDF